MSGSNQIIIAISVPWPVKRRKRRRKTKLRWKQRLGQAVILVVSVTIIWTLKVFFLGLRKASALLWISLKITFRVAWFCIELLCEFVSGFCEGFEKGYNEFLEERSDK